MLQGQALKCQSPANSSSFGNWWWWKGQGVVQRWVDSGAKARVKGMGSQSQWFQVRNKMEPAHQQSCFPPSVAQRMLACVPCLHSKASICRQWNGVRSKSCRFCPHWVQWTDAVGYENWILKEGFCYLKVRIWTLPFPSWATHAVGPAFVLCSSLFSGTPSAKEIISWWRYTPQEGYLLRR